MQLKYKILNHGYIKYIGHYGSDKEIIQAARMSTGGTNKSDEEDRKLIDYLMKNKHTSPFEMADIIFEVQAPIFVFREWQRHRTLCLDGDTLIYFDAKMKQKRPRSVVKKSIKDIWERLYIKKSGKGNNPNCGWPINNMLLRCLNENSKEIINSKIIDVIKSEPKQMVKITTQSGKSLIATRKHKIYTPTGWTILGEAIDNNLLIAVQGTKRNKLQKWHPKIDTNKEIWRTVVGFEKVYQVSNQGRVKNNKRILTQNYDDYPRVILGKKPNRNHKYVHILVLEAFIGPKPIGMEARHKNHNRWDSRLENLSWGTHVENSQDSIQDDRFVKLVAVYEPIIKVQDAGIRDSYDLVVQGPHHNFVANGIITHNSFNELSGRYSEMPNLFYVPEDNRYGKQGKINKQGTGDLLSEEDRRKLKWNIENEQIDARTEYEQKLAIGLSREIARINLPLSQYSRMRVKGNLLNWFRFIDLRSRSNAMWEIQQYSNAIFKFLTEIFPWSCNAFREFWFDTITISNVEKNILAAILQEIKYDRLYNILILNDIKKPDELLNKLGVTNEIHRPE